MDYCASSKHQLAPTESRSAGRRTRAVVLTLTSIFPDAKLAGPSDTQPGDNTSQRVQTECHALITPHRSQSKEDLILLQTVWKAADSVIAVEVSGVSSATN